MNEQNQPKTFEEIDERLLNDLMQISGEIEEIERHLQVAQEMFEKESQQGITAEASGNYKKGIEELQKGLEMFLNIREEILQTRKKLHETKKQADEFIKNR